MRPDRRTIPCRDLSSKKYRPFRLRGEAVQESQSQRLLPFDIGTEPHPPHTGGGTNPTCTAELAPPPTGSAPPSSSGATPDESRPSTKAPPPARIVPTGREQQHRVPREAVEEMKCVQEGQENQDRQRPRDEGSEEEEEDTS
eukprot:CAMPEP_0183304932 /NCGR_PEP_ID=MMETSP0160_2-20130417/9844_1 /TAXON_ID=2839 ORGANISM="Odontella Sinensis, Strain Grunow 1884" /NCGR_SAMPLE_ID=MMETSP0160_2 /ASSEMBLY_ACC=CAM_ASM_000250 /LENGTH=141 /DNA_ID=CAMNT_0025468053 /DNA_START=167 /DNA_END=590 /DNA_ORIENTATION=-